MKFKVLLNRFLRGFIAGAVASLAALLPVSFNSLNDIKAWLFIAMMTAFSGGLTGGLLALDKALRWKKEIPPEEIH